MGFLIESCEQRLHLSTSGKAPVVPAFGLIEDGWYYELRGDQQTVQSVGAHVNAPTRAAFEFLKAMQIESQSPEELARVKASFEASRMQRAWQIQSDREVAALEAGLDPMSVRPIAWGGQADIDPLSLLSPVTARQESPDSRSLDLLSNHSDDSILDALDP